MKQTGSNDVQQYVPGRMPERYTTWGGYWGYWGPHWVTYYSPGTPGHQINTYTWYVQATVYSLKSNTLIWTANTSTTKPGGPVPLFDDVCNAVTKKLSNDGVLQ